jgi:uncharacterized membrane protein YkvA (DUF1232 family)
MTNASYGRYYSEAGFSSKIKKLTGPVLAKAVLLYLILVEKKTPPYVKLAIIAALGYFICPIDAIPDYLPFGYVDDLAVMTVLLTSIEAYVTEEMRQKAKSYTS